MERSKTDVSVSDLCVTSFLKDSQLQQAVEPKDDFTFFPDIIGGFSSDGKNEKIDGEGEGIDDFLSDQMLDQSRHTSADVEGNGGMVLRIEPDSPCIDRVADDCSSSIGHLWDWDNDINPQNFDDESFLEILGAQSQELDASTTATDAAGSDDQIYLGQNRKAVDRCYHENNIRDDIEEYAISDRGSAAKNDCIKTGAFNDKSLGNNQSHSTGIVKQKAPKKRMLEISASASLRAEAVAKSKELVLQAKREMAKRTRIRRKKPKKRRVVVEQKLVELIRMIRMCKRVRAEATEFLSSNGNNKIKIVISQKLRVVSLAIEAFLNSFMFVQPSDHEYIFQLVRPISESCTLSVPALASLVTEAKNVLPFDVNTLPLVVPSKFYGFSEILRASEIFGDVIRFLLNSCLISEQVAGPDITPPAFSTNLSHSNAAVSLIGDRITVPFLWKSCGLKNEIELRGMVSCKLSNDLVVSITLHFDPFSVIRQSTPSAGDLLIKMGENCPSPFSF